MISTQIQTRFFSGICALALAAAAGAQISNVTSDIGYNNLEEGYNGPDIFGFEHQFLFLDNPPTTSLSSPVSDYTFSSPVTLGTGECKASSSVTAALSSTATSAELDATGFATAEIITQDFVDNYWSSAANGMDLILDLSTEAKVTFSLSNFSVYGKAGSQYGFNNTYGGDFFTAGNHSASTLIGPGSYDMYMFFFDNMPVSSGPIDDYAYAGGNYSIQVQSVPEPTPYAVFAVGALGLVLRRRRSQILAP